MRETRRKTKNQIYFTFRQVEALLAESLLSFLIHFHPALACGSFMGCVMSSLVLNLIFKVIFSSFGVFLKALNKFTHESTSGLDITDEQVRFRRKSRENFYRLLLFQLLSFFHCCIMKQPPRSS